MLAPLLLAALPLLLAPPPATPAPKPDTKIPAETGNASEVFVSSVQPALARVGEPLTVTGRGLSKVKAVLFGSFCPVLSEQTDERIVFAVPFDRRRPEGFEATPILLVPGREVVASGPAVQVRYGSLLSRTDPQASAAIVLLDESVSVSAGSPRRFELQAPRVRGLVVELSVTGKGEVSARLEPLDAPGPGSMRVTYGGRLVWRPNRRELFGARAEEEGPRRLALTLASDGPRAVDVSVSVRAGSTDGPVGK